MPRKLAKAVKLQNSWGLTHQCGSACYQLLSRMKCVVRLFGRLYVTYVTSSTLAQCTGAGRVQARPHACSAVHNQAPQYTSSTSASLSPVSPPDNIFAVPAEVFLSCLAIVSAVMVRWLFLWPARRYGTGYQTGWDIRPSPETPSSIHWRRLYS